MLIPAQYVKAFPLIPGGGLFFIPIGLCIVIGAFYPVRRMALVWAGITAGVLAILLGARFLRGLPPPTTIQVASFAIAIVAEAVAFRVIIPRLRSAGEHPVQVAALGIVGAHFLLMIPAFGWPIVVMAALCLGNAFIAYTTARYPISAAWFVDGIFKLSVGVIMWTASPFFTTP
jgi:hypothetical protein